MGTTDKDVNAKLEKLAKDLKITPDQALRIVVSKGIEGLGARGYTKGDDAFGAGAKSGSLMAHEATHVIQQKHGDK